MKIVNDGLPEDLYQAICNDDYTRGDADISVTQLIDSPRVRMLYKKHDHEMEIKASSLLAAFFGKAFHKAIELATKSGAAERRLSLHIDGWKLSGGMDKYDLHALDHAVLMDYKTCSAWKLVYEPSAFEEQLNVYAEILRQNGSLVSHLKVFCFFKDWMKKDLRSARDLERIGKWKHPGKYPGSQWVTIDVPLWPQEVAREYISHRVGLHQQAEKTLPKCSYEEIWRGLRCREYCAAVKFCDQANKHLKTGLME